MRAKEKLNSGTPMLEIVLSIGIFGVISVFILQLFLAADTFQKKSKDLSRAVIEAQSVMEVLKAMDNKEAIDYMKLSLKEDNTYVKYYDDKWQPCDKEGKFSIIVKINVQEETRGSLNELEVVIKRQGEEILSLNGASYKRRQTDNEK